MAVADVVIKQEAVDVVDLEERVVQLCKENPKGITDQIISQDMPNIPPQQRVTAINRLLSMVGNPSNPGWWSPGEFYYLVISRVNFSFSWLEKHVNFQSRIESLCGSQGMDTLKVWIIFFPIHRDGLNF